MPSDRLLVAFCDELFSYDFGPYHPLNRSRTDVFVRRLMELRVRAPERIELVEPAPATEEEVTLFHTKEYVEFVKLACSPGSKIRYLDYGDTPAYSLQYSLSAPYYLQKLFSTLFILRIDNPHYLPESPCMSFNSYMG